MTKEILIQYCDLREEIKDLHKRVQKLTDQIEKIEKSGAVIDSVNGGMGGLEHFKISGFPYPEYSRKKTVLCVRKAKLQDSEYRLLELTNKVEEYIDGLGDSRIRRIFRFRYIDGMSWTQTAMNMRGKATCDSVRMEHDRFITTQ